MNNNKFVVATDCDDVLVDIGSEWIKRALRDEELVKALSESHIELARSCHPSNRNHYYIATHFGFQPKEVPQWINERLMSLYFESEDFYDDLPPTPYLQSLVAMANQGTLGKLVIPTQCVDLRSPVTRSKAKFLKRELVDKLPAGFKYEFLFLSKGEKKSDAINAQAPDYDTFADDHAENIIDVLANTNSYSKEFIVPMFRHNIDGEQSKQMEVLAAEKEARIVWLDNGLPIRADQSGQYDAKVIHPSDLALWNV
jgi:hypothetical protein